MSNKTITATESIALYIALSDYAVAAKAKAAEAAAKATKAEKEGEANAAALRAKADDLRKKAEEAEAEAAAAKANAETHHGASVDEKADDLRKDAKAFTAALATAGGAKYARFVSCGAYNVARRICKESNTTVSAFASLHLLSKDAKLSKAKKEAYAKAKALANAAAHDVVKAFGLNQHNMSSAEFSYLASGAVNIQYGKNGVLECKPINANLMFARLFTIAAARLNGTKITDALDAHYNGYAAKEAAAEAKRNALKPSTEEEAAAKEAAAKAEEAAKAEHLEQKRKQKQEQKQEQTAEAAKAEEPTKAEAAAAEAEHAAD